MIGWLRERLTYANVASTIALVLALGGTSYAAITLPRNSVGSEQVRSRAIESRHVDNGSLRLADLGPGARRTLRGQEGAGWSAGGEVLRGGRARGELLRGNATGASHTVGGSGAYTVGFAQSVAGCVYSATLGTVDGNTPAAGRTTVTDRAGQVGVQTFDSAGNPADLPFHLIVAC